MASVQHTYKLVYVKKKNTFADGNGIQTEATVPQPPGEAQLKTKLIFESRWTI